MRLSPVVAAALLAVQPASAADGRLGPTSQGSVRISVSVAPRAWQTASPTGQQQLCVAAGGGFDLASTDSQPLTWQAVEGGCAFGGTAVQVMDLADGSTTVLVRPE